MPSPNRPIVLTVWCVGLFLACLWLFTQNNNFPLTYNMERSKARQVLSESGTRNFKHPQLLLEGSALAMQMLVFRENRSRPSSADGGVAATFGAFAVVVLAICGYLAAGALGLLSVSVTVGLCPMLLTNAHYMKEDIALVMGIALVMLSTKACHAGRLSRHHLLGPVSVGAATAVAAAGKYVGLNMLAVAAAAVAISRNDKTSTILSRLSVMMATFALGWALINYRALMNFEHFCDGLGFEYQHVTTGHGPVAAKWPVVFLFNAALVNTQPHLWLLAALYVPLAFMRRREDGWGPVPPLIFLLWLATLSFSLVPLHRHVLPLVVILHFLAGIAMAWSLERLRVMQRL